MDKTALAKTALDKMKHRAKFVKGELEEIYNLLNASFEYIDYSQVENDKRFIKIFELLMEISEKSNTLRQVVKGSYFV